MITITDITAAVVRGNADELAELALELWGRIVYLESAPRKRQKAVAKATEPERVTWLTPIKEAYEKEMGLATLNYGLAAKTLAPLINEGKYTPEEVAKRLGYYLRKLRRADEVKFLSLPRFVATFADYDPDAPAFGND